MKRSRGQSPAMLTPCETIVGRVMCFPDDRFALSKGELGVVFKIKCIVRFKEDRPIEVEETELVSLDGVVAFYKRRFVGAAIELRPRAA
jgi:hypothetical protein